MQALKWGKEMVAMSGSGSGYVKTTITPYMYSLIFHVPTMMQRHGSLRCFSGQGILFKEKQTLCTVFGGANLIMDFLEREIFGRRSQ